MFRWIFLFPFVRRRVIMIQKSDLIKALIISLAFIFGSCQTINKTNDNDTVQKLQPDSVSGNPNGRNGKNSRVIEERSTKPDESRVPPSFGETPRYRGSINPIYPAGQGASGY